MEKNDNWEGGMGWHCQEAILEEVAQWAGRRRRV